MYSRIVFHMALGENKKEKSAFFILSIRYLNLIFTGQFWKPLLWERALSITIIMR